MSLQAFSATVNTVFKRFGTTIVKTIMIYSIALFVVEIPTFWHLMIRAGKSSERFKKQHRLRAKLIDPSDSSAPYRAIEVVDGLRTTPNERVKTLADIPDYALENFADKETQGVREILAVEDEKQPNGKIFKKVGLYPPQSSVLFVF